MLIAEPPPTAYDVRFNIGSIPVRVSPWFWGMSLLFGLGPMNSPNPTNEVVIWMLVVFVSILVHELGHALTALACGWPPRIVLYAMGGVAIFRPTYYNMGRNILTLLAGPGAGFLLAMVLLIGLAVAGFPPSFAFRAFQPGDGWPAFDTSLFSISLLQAPEDRNLMIFIWYALQVNIFWGVVNLMPVFPLDGGQIARELLSNANGRDGLKQSLQLSILTGVLMAVLGLSMGSSFIVILFAVLAFQSWQMLQQISMGGGGRGGW